MQQVRPQTHAFYESETDMMPTLQLSGKRLILPPQTKPLLPMDDLCRPYLVSHEKRREGILLWDDTVCQVADMVDRYRKLYRGRYPLEIVLNAERYFVRRLNRFYPFGDKAVRPIPYRYENAEASYEIIVRGIV